MTHPCFKTPTDELDAQPRAPITWGCGIAAAIVLIAALALTGQIDEQQLAQTQAEHEAWQAGLAAGRQQVQDELAATLASVHEQGRRAGRTQVACGGRL